MTSFKNVKVGGRFFHDGFEYIKICNHQNDEIGAVNVCTGTHFTDCANWVVEVPIKPTKEKVKEQDDEIAIFVYEFDEAAPVIMKITKEQKRIIEILYDYDILCDDISVSFKDDTFIVDATKE